MKQQGNRAESPLMLAPGLGRGRHPDLLVEEEGRGWKNLCGSAPAWQQGGL